MKKKLVSVAMILILLLTACGVEKSDGKIENTPNTPTESHEPSNEQSNEQTETTEPKTDDNESKQDESEEFEWDYVLTKINKTVDDGSSLWVIWLSFTAYQSSIELEMPDGMTGHVYNMKNSMWKDDGESLYLYELYGEGEPSFAIDYHPTFEDIDIDMCPITEKGALSDIPNINRYAGYMGKGFVYGNGVVACNINSSSSITRSGKRLTQYEVVLLEGTTMEELANELSSHFVFGKAEEDGWGATFYVEADVDIEVSIFAYNGNDEYEWDNKDEQAADDHFWVMWGIDKSEYISDYADAWGYKADNGDIMWFSF